MQVRRLQVSKRPASSGAESPTLVTPRVRRVAIAIAGFSVLIFGVALIVVPIPGTSIVVIPLGLAILAREFRWARRLLGWSTAAVKRVWAGVRRLFAAVSGRHVTFLPLRAFTRGPRLAYSSGCHIFSEIRRKVRWRRTSPVASGSQRRW